MPRNFERVLTRNIIFSHQFIHLDSTKINSYSFNKLSSIRIKKILLSRGIIHYFHPSSSFLASLSKFTFQINYSNRLQKLKIHYCIPLTFPLRMSFRTTTITNSRWILIFRDLSFLTAIKGVKQRGD